VWEPLLQALPKTLTISPKTNFLNQLRRKRSLKSKLLKKYPKRNRFRFSLKNPRKNNSQKQNKNKSKWSSPKHNRRTKIFRCRYKVIHRYHLRGSIRVSSRIFNTLVSRSSNNSSLNSHNIMRICLSRILRKKPNLRRILSKRLRIQGIPATKRKLAFRMVLTMSSRNNSCSSSISSSSSNNI